METELEKQAALDLEKYEQENRSIIQSLVDAKDGDCEKAASASSNMIRRQIRENGFTRRVLPPKQVSDSDLNRLPTTELPVIVEK